MLRDHLLTNLHSLVRPARSIPFVHATLMCGLLHLSGCFTTHTGPFEQPPHLAALVESAEVQMPLYVHNAVENRSHGYQFLLFILPIARVFPDGLSDLVANKVTVQAGFGRYGMVSPAARVPATPRLEVEIKQVSINGYDLFVTRRPSASISLVGTLYGMSGGTRECRVDGSFSEFSRFAFAADLDNALEQATELAAKELVSCLRLIVQSEAESEKNGEP